MWLREHGRRGTTSRPLDAEYRGTLMLSNGRMRSILGPNRGEIHRQVWGQFRGAI